ncbi:MAG: hypothetical protein AB7G47_10345 [Mycolicibacterium sp.]|uniref:hypothetical protein n=1 Tax=Mycolicibacterium sp. TaxID=2320850 RepID=UPI003D0A19C8
MAKNLATAPTTCHAMSGCITGSQTTSCGRAIARRADVGDERHAEHIIEIGLGITNYTTTDNPVPHGEFGATNDPGGQWDTPPKNPIDKPTPRGLQGVHGVVTVRRASLARGVLDVSAVAAIRLV